MPATVVASSDKAYGPSEELPYREEMQLRPASPYEASKAAADAIALSYFPAYGLPVGVTRFANIYGGGDLNFSRLIPEAIAAVLDGRRPQIRSDGSPERDFLHVDDAVAAYFAVEHAVGAGGPGAGQAFNAGGEQPHPVAEVLETVAEVSGAGLDPEYHGLGSPAGEIDRQYVDSSKLRRLTGWRPEVELREGLRPHPRVVPRPPGGSCLMCGRFTVAAKDTKKIADRFQVELERALERGGDGGAPPPTRERAERASSALGRFNVAPTQEVLTVRSSPDPEEAALGEREARLMRWGLVPRWAKDLKVSYRMINAKAENLTTSRAYAPLIGKFRHRCLIVADGFYEWMRAEDPKQPRQPWRFTVDGGEPFAFAGICTRKEWEEEGNGVEDGWLYSCTIVTTTPNELVAKVHDRMPAILPGPEAEAAWLRPDLELEEAVAMCAPLPAARMSSAPANPRLNKVGKGIEGPELLVAPAS